MVSWLVGGLFCPSAFLLANQALVFPWQLEPSVGHQVLSQNQPPTTNFAPGVLPTAISRQHQGAWESRMCISAQSVQTAPSRRSEKPPMALVKDSITRSAPCNAGCNMQGPHQVLSTTSSRRCCNGGDGDVFRGDAFRVVGLGCVSEWGACPSLGGIFFPILISLQNRHQKQTYGNWQ